MSVYSLSLLGIFSSWKAEARFAARLLLVAMLWPAPLIARGGGPIPTAAQRTAHAHLLAEMARLTPRMPYLVVDTHDNVLAVRTVDSVLYRARCATGSGRKLEGRKAWHRWTFATPRGRFSVLRKVMDPVWVRPTWDFIEAGEDIPALPEDARRFQRGVLGLRAIYFRKDYMIHGTLYETNLGKSITHGCVRIGSADLSRVYAMATVGFPVYVY